VDSESEPLTFQLEEDYRETISFHRWFAMRRTNAARAAVAFTTAPEWLSDPEKLALVATGDDAAIATAIAEYKTSRKTDNIDPHRVAKAERILDLCAGIGTVGAMAARLGFDAVSVELSVVPHLIDRVLHEFAVSMAKPSTPVTSAPSKGHSNSWRGFVTEIDNFANRVWCGAKERLKELFEEDVNIRLWVRMVMCPSCGRQVPLFSHARLSPGTTLEVRPDFGNNEGEFPRFNLVQKGLPNLKGTLVRGIGACPSCHNHFPLRGYDLIPLRSVPVAVRIRNSNELSAIDSPDVYTRQVEAGAHDSLAASSRNLGNRAILSEEQSLFHDARGEPISVHNALLPRQRAYFAALAEAMDRESALLAARAELTDDHRFAVRTAVALLISGQVDYVNTYTHWLADKPHPSIFAGSLRLGGLFAEVGGFWLERFWQNRLRLLLRLLQENSSVAYPVHPIQADAAAIPLDDSKVSAVVWDPPYYDNVDYDAAGEPYQAILAAMVPDLVSELIVPPKLPPPERTERYERELLQQAHEARRIVKSQGGIGVFWLAQEPAELQRFLEKIAPAGLQLVRAVRLDTIRASRIFTETGPRTYLLVLQPILAAASAVVIDAEKVLALATVGALSLYDGLTQLLESVWDPTELDGMIPDEFRGSSRQRLVGFLASHPEPEQLLVEVGRITLVHELVNRGADAKELRAIDARGLAQRLLAQLGFAVARPVRFSIRAALRECEIAENRLELADSIEAARGAFLTGCRLVERILRYASFAWSHLACGSLWNEPLEQIISSSTPGRSYPGPDKLTFGQYELLFTKLPATFAVGDDLFVTELFTKISRIIKKTKIHDKLSTLVALRNAVEHDKGDVASLSLTQLRQQCCAVLTATCTVLVDIDSQHLLPLTVRPEEERRDRYGRRILRLLDSDGAAIEAYVGSEMDLTEPLIYFASDSSRRDVDPKFLRASIVEELLGLN
jgi:hypothetical protein